MRPSLSILIGSFFGRFIQTGMHLSSCHACIGNGLGGLTSLSHTPPPKPASDAGHALPAQSVPDPARSHGQ
jgi:hypothetical protein